MSDWTSIVKPLTDKISDFLNIFDLSFFISGVTCLLALLLAYSVLDDSIFSTLTTTKIFFVLLGCYILGLLCFSLGRWLRKDRPNYYNNFYRQFHEAVTAHSLDKIPSFQSYFQAELLNGDISRSYRLYNRLWAEIRHQEKSELSLKIINRYWVMAATYDGLSIALLVWLIAIEFVWVKKADLLLTNILNVTDPALIIWCKALLFIIWAAIFGFFAKICSNEASRYTKHQVEELAATIASIYERKL